MSRLGGINYMVKILKCNKCGENIKDKEEWSLYVSRSKEHYYMDICTVCLNRFLNQTTYEPEVSVF